MQPGKLFLAASVAVCACSVTSDHALEDYGPPPVDSEQQAVTYYRAFLLEPDAAQFLEFSKPERIWLRTRLDGPSYGYYICVTLRAKNAAGHVVEMLDAIVIRHNQVVLRIANAYWDGKDLCKNARGTSL